MTHLALVDRDFGEADYEMLLRLDELDGAEKRKASSRSHSKLLENLPCRRLSKNEARSEDVCVICLENMRAQQHVVALPCKHEYHKPCILKWLKTADAPTCPQCKAPALLPADSGSGSTQGVARTSCSPARVGECESGADTTEPGAEHGEEWWHT